MSRGIDERQQTLQSIAEDIAQMKEHMDVEGARNTDAGEKREKGEMKLHLSSSSR